MDKFVLCAIDLEQSLQFAGFNILVYVGDATQIRQVWALLLQVEYSNLQNSEKKTISIPTTSLVISQPLNLRMTPLIFLSNTLQ